MHLTTTAIRRHTASVLVVLYREARNLAESPSYHMGMTYAAATLLEPVIRQDEEGAALDDVLESVKARLLAEGWDESMLDAWLGNARVNAMDEVLRERG